MGDGKLSRGVRSSLVPRVSWEEVLTIEDWLCPGGGRRRSLVAGSCKCSSVTCVSLPHSGRSAQEGGGEREKGKGRRGRRKGEEREGKGGGEREEERIFAQ